MQNEIKALSHGNNSNKSEIAILLRKIDALDQQFLTTDKINEEVEDLQKSFKESQLDTQIQMESMKDSIKKCNLPDMGIFPGNMIPFCRIMLLITFTWLAFTYSN